MVRDRVKARRVGDSLVVTLTKPVLEETQIMEDDSLVLETFVNGRVMVRKEHGESTPLQRLELELQILQKHLEALQAENALMEYEYSHSMPTKHPGIEETTIGQLYAREQSWAIAKCEEELAQKRLELFEAGGELE